jgi:DNA gyrase subunit A
MGKHNKEVYNYDRNVIEENIGDKCTLLMKIFGANNNLMRHLPFLVDGLKPGERRILYALYAISKAGHTVNPKKVISLIGDVLKLHPHGDMPVYDTIVKLAQDWQNTQCLIYGDGNFGSPMGDKAGAPRYIEAKLSYYAYKCFFEEFSPEIVDMVPSYNGEFMEPEFLPSKYPNVMISNMFGIGYGISCGLPNYNFKEVIELTMKLMDDPDLEDITILPDSPTSAFIIDEGQFPEICATGKGKFKMRGEIVIDEENNILTIKSTPLQVFTNDVKQDILHYRKKERYKVLQK